MNLVNYDCPEGIPESEFVPLDVMSDNSIGESIARIPELVKKAESLNMKALALTDRTLSGSIEFYQLCMANNVKPIIGQKITVKNNEINLLCKDLKAYKILCRHSLEFQEANKCTSTTTTISLSKDEASHFICITLHPDSKLLKIFEDNLYTQIDFAHLKKHPETIEKLDTAKCIVTNQIRYIKKEDYQALLAFKQNYSENLTEISSNNYFADDTEIIPFLETINHLELVKNTQQIAAQITPIFPEKYFTTQESLKRIQKSLPFVKDAKNKLRQLAQDAFEKKYSEFDDTNITKERLEYELNYIITHHWERVFLLHYELETWCCQNGIEYGPGRGSAPSSLVSYLLGITSVNPIKNGLLYERFLNPYNPCYPNFDIDYDYDRLREVVNHLKEKYGNKNVIRIAVYRTINCWQALEIAGKYLNYRDEEIQCITDIIMNNWDPKLNFTRLLDCDSYFYKNIFSSSEGGEIKRFLHKKKNEKLVKLAQKLENVKCSFNLHSSGYIVTRNSAYNFLPVQKDEKTGWLYSEYTFDILEHAGLYKNDLLGLKHLTKLKRLSQEVEKKTKKAFDYRTIPLEDEKTIEMFAKGRTTDVFQFDQLGIKKILKQIKPEHFSDLVLMNTLYRPELMDYIRFVLKYKESGQKWNIFPGCEDILTETYGFPFYQEQIMQIVHELADYTFAEANLFRRALATKKPDVLIAIKREFIERTQKKSSLTEKQAEDIFEFLIPFAGYSFNKSHSIAYTMLNYWDMYMKVYYPKEYKKIIKTLEKKHKEEDWL